MPVRAKGFVLLVVAALMLSGCVWWRNFWGYLTGDQTIIISPRVSISRSDKIAVVAFQNQTGYIDPYNACEKIPMAIAQDIRDHTGNETQYYSRIPGYDPVNKVFDQMRVRNFTKARFIVSGFMDEFTDNVHQNPLYKGAYLRVAFAVWDLEEHKKVYEGGCMEKLGRVCAKI